MKSFCTVAVIAAQATAFSTAKVPATNISTWSPTQIPPLVTSTSRAGVTPSRAKTTKLALSPASMGALLLRGGAAAVDNAVVLKDFYGDALGFFGGIRIPATFLAGSSLAAIFTLKSVASDPKPTKLERRTIKFYHLISVVAFLLSLNTIITASMAHISILHGRFDPMAETAYMMMKTKFEYEFVSVRWSFLTSIFCFLGMVTSRVLLEFGLLKECNETSKDLAMLVVCSVGALAAHLLSYVNQNLWCWRSLVGMTVYLTQLIMKRAFVEKRPLQIVSVLCTMASAFYLAKLTAKDLKEEP